MDQRFEAIDQRFEAFQQQIEQRFEAVDRRFEAIDQQLNKIWTPMLVMIAGIFGLIGYIVWDRKTALRPVEQRIMTLEAEFHRDLEIQHEDGSRLIQLVKVLKEMAKSDENWLTCCEASRCFKAPLRCAARSTVDEKGS